MLNKVVKTLKLARGRVRLFFGFCPACNSDAPEMYDCHVCEWPLQPFAGIGQSATIKKTWWENFKRQLSGPSPAPVIQPDPKAESCTAAAWPLPGTFTVDNMPPGPILSQHYGPVQDAAAVAVLTGTDPDVFIPRPGVEYFECDECGQETAFCSDHSFSPSGRGSYMENYKCENPACGYTCYISA